jgi:L-ascorbate metabolism protein UlaG (beta-lactamase superfamily)
MEIEFKWFGGGNWMIVVDGIKVICDPVLCPAGSIHDYRFFKSRRINSACFSESDLRDVNVWLFTHGHKDHCDFGNLRPINNESKIVADLSASRVLKRLGYGMTTILKWGEKTELLFSKGITMIFEAVPAIHGLNRSKGKLIGNGNGYWIEIIKPDQKYSIYVSGDTLPNRTTMDAIGKRSCDLFIANVGNATVGNGFLAKFIGKITMNISDAVMFQNLINSKMSIPIHWDAFEHYQERNISAACVTNGFRFIKPGETVSILV